MTDRELLARIAASPGRKAGYKQLVRELGLGGGRERRLLHEQLSRLTVQGQLVQPERDQWGIPRPTGPRTSATRDNLIAGRLDLHRDGYGFVRPNRKSGEPGARQASGITEDIFIPPNEINNAMQGDQVLVEVEPPKPDGRRQGRILRVLERGNPTVVGTFRIGIPGDRSSSAGWNVVIPFDDRMTQPILIPSGQEIPTAPAALTPHRVLGREATASPKPQSSEGASNINGLVVDVEITSWPTPTRPPLAA